MADSSKKELSKSNVNNEDIINELTKDLETACINSNEDNSPSSSKSSENSEHPDFQLKNEALPKNSMIDPENFDKDEKDHSDEESEEDYEIKLKDEEVSMTDSEREARKTEAENHKTFGNDKFKSGEYEESIVAYSEGLKICPLSFSKDRAVLYSNRAASKMKLNKNKEAIKDCTKAIENDDTYIKAYYRRAQCYEQTDSLDESLADYNKILEFDPDHSEARKAVVRLPPKIEERNERMKTEMISKLKDLGNLVLKPFGLSTENFKLVQDPETKGYSVSFQQNK